MDNERQRLDRARAMVLTLSEVPDALAVYGRAMLIHIGHEELAEMPYDRPTDTLVGDPLDDRLRLDVAQLFERNLLHYIEQRL